MSDLVTGTRLVARLRAIRKAQGKSAQDVADAIGVLSRSSIANVEAGRRTAYSYDEARLIAEFLGVDLREVISAEPMRIVMRPADEVTI